MGGEKQKRRGRKLSLRTAFAAGGLLLLTATAAAAWFSGGADLILDRKSGIYGVDCKLLDSVAFHEGRELWVRQYISVGEAGPAERLRTALRVAAHAAADKRADLVLVVAVDRNGPSLRALMRDSAVGARVVYAPHPGRVAGVGAPLDARYVDAAPTDAGEFYGKAVRPPSADLEKMMAAMPKPYGCKTPEETAKPVEASAHAKKKPAHH